MIWNLILIPYIFLRRYFKVWRSGLNPIIMFRAERLFCKKYSREKLRNKMTENEKDEAAKIVASLYKMLSKK